MKREEFCEVLGDINENYVKEAGANPKAERRRRFKWKVIAACLCLLLAAPLTVFAMDTIQYHAAVDYLRSLGIPVEDLSDYSRTEIKEAVKTMDAGESSLLTEEILNLLPDSGEPITKANTGDIRTGQGIDTDHDARRGPFIFGRYPGHRFRHLHIYL